MPPPPGVKTGLLDRVLGVSAAQQHCCRKPESVVEEGAELSLKVSRRCTGVYGEVFGAGAAGQ